MITQQTIEQVEAISIVDAYEKCGVALKKKGANYTGLCPYHDEKTPSFTVSEAKNLGKCFGCGKANVGPVSVYMSKKNLDWKDAIKELASDFNITIQYDDSDIGRAKAAKWKKKETISELNTWALSVFQKNLDKISPEDLRMKPETAEVYGIGFALDDWHYLEKQSVEDAKSIADLVEASLLGVKKEGKGNFDFWRNRIVFPVCGTNNKVIGFSGRTLSKELNEHGKLKDAKYINSRETAAYNKEMALLGLQVAKEEIVKQNLAYLVEGNYDVTAMYESSFPNTVAPCGTAFTNLQAKLLKKYCDTVCIIGDGDNAGVTASKKAVLVLLKEGFVVMINHLPEGGDPDSFCKTKDMQAQIKEKTEDAVLYMAREFWKGAVHVSQKTKALTHTAEMLAKIDNEDLRSGYVDEIAKAHKLKLPKINGAIKKVLNLTQVVDSKERTIVIPKGGKMEDYEHYGFCEVEKGNNTGYHFTKDGSYFTKESNFVIRPLFHVESETDNKRIIEIINKRKKVMLDLDSKALISQQLFSEEVYKKGNFLFQGQKFHFQKVISKISEKMPTCKEIKTLGWHDDGFYAFANGAIIDDQFRKVDEYGIIEKEGNKYFLPAESSIYKHLGREDDIYENERTFRFIKSSIDFEEWGKQMNTVHGPNGACAVAFLTAALFRDHIFGVMNFFPHLFLVGDVETGKSYCASSINAVFHGSQPPFNLTSGTKVGMIRRMSKQSNAVQWFDEYDNDFDKGRYDLLKGSYDGSGYEKGLMSQDNRTVTNKVLSASIISGQHIATRDQNALFTRIINLLFTNKSRNLTNDQKEAGAKLKALEAAGLSSILKDVLKYRGLVIRDFSKVVQSVQKELKKEMKPDSFSGRVLGNYSVVLATVKILEDKIKLPLSYDTYKSLFVKMIEEQSSQISESDALHTFWSKIQFLESIGLIMENHDFKIRWNQNEVRLTENKADFIKDFDGTKNLLFINLTKMYQLYRKETKSAGSETPINETSLKTYFKSSNAYLGRVNSMRFGKKSNSGYVFDYDKLNLTLHDEYVNDPDNIHTDVDNNLTPSKDFDEEPFIEVGAKQNDIPFN